MWARRPLTLNGLSRVPVQPTNSSPSGGGDPAFMDGSSEADTMESEGRSSMPVERRRSVPQCGETLHDRRSSEEVYAGRETSDGKKSIMSRKISLADTDGGEGRSSAGTVNSGPPRRRGAVLRPEPKRDPGMQSVPVLLERLRTLESAREAEEKAAAQAKGKLEHENASLKLRINELGRSLRENMAAASDEFQALTERVKKAEAEARSLRNKREDELRLKDEEIIRLKDENATLELESYGGSRSRAGSSTSGGGTAIDGIRNIVISPNHVSAETEQRINQARETIARCASLQQAAAGKVDTEEHTGSTTTPAAAASETNEVLAVEADQEILEVEAPSCEQDTRITSVLDAARARVETAEREAVAARRAAEEAQRQVARIGGGGGGDRSYGSGGGGGGTVMSGLVASKVAKYSSFAAPKSAV